MAKAQGVLGVMSFKGMGLLQDLVMAHMWLNVASANGDEGAANVRDKIAPLMTSADLSKAQTMARKCMNSNHKNCGW